MVSLTHPPDVETLAKIYYLRRYRFFINEARMFSLHGSSAQELYNSLIPGGCKVQFLQVEYSDDNN